MQDNKCFDCGKDIEVTEGEVRGGVYLKYQDGDKELYIFKCNECYEKSPALTNFRPCEVYSRVCGYFRPVGVWNQGKVQEYEERKEFKSE